MGINEDRRGTATRRTILTASVVTAGVAASAGPAAADPAAGTDLPALGKPNRPQPPDRELRRLLREIDPKRIEATIQRLVAFGTRHTLSSQTDPVRGIGAARDWLLAPRPTEATIVFTAVAGEEQGLYGSAFQAKQYKAAGVDVPGMISNDIVGSSTADDGTRNPHVVRLFADGVPPTETAQQAAIRQAVGGEVDSPARQLARFAQEVGQND